MVKKMVKWSLFLAFFLFSPFVVAVAVSPALEPCNGTIIVSNNLDKKAEFKVYTAHGTLEFVLNPGDSKNIYATENMVIEEVTEKDQNVVNAIAVSTKSCKDTGQTKQKIIALLPFSVALIAITITIVTLRKQTRFRNL